MKDGGRRHCRLNADFGVGDNVTRAVVRVAALDVPPKTARFSVSWENARESFPSNVRLPGELIAGLQQPILLVGGLVCYRIKTE